MGLSHGLWNRSGGNGRRALSTAALLEGKRMWPRSVPEVEMVVFLPFTKEQVGV